MSFHRENVAWPSRDGSWNYGFYAADVVGDDPEWDVDYDYSAFDWVTTGHVTLESAWKAWTGSNPGGGMVIETCSAETDHLDEMAAQYRSNKFKMKL